MTRDIGNAEPTAPAPMIAVFLTRKNIAVAMRSTTLSPSRVTTQSKIPASYGAAYAKLNSSTAFYQLLTRCSPLIDYSHRVMILRADHAEAFTDSKLRAAAFQVVINNGEASAAR
jgi:hypothetical protein